MCLCVHLPCLLLDYKAKILQKCIKRQTGEGCLLRPWNPAWLTRRQSYWSYLEPAKANEYAVGLLKDLQFKFYKVALSIFFFSVQWQQGRKWWTRNRIFCLPQHLSGSGRLFAWRTATPVLNTPDYIDECYNIFDAENSFAMGDSNLLESACLQGGGAQKEQLGGIVGKGDFASGNRILQLWWQG